MASKVYCHCLGMRNLDAESGLAEAADKTEGQREKNV
jgi:hypothetical protein